MKFFKNGLVFIFLMIFNFAIGADNNYLGTEELYNFKEIQYTSPPKGYTPIYINHLGRHGNRYLSNGKGLEYIYGTLVLGENRDGLTERGKQLKKDIDIVLKNEDNHFGMLSELGKKTQYEIGERMYKNFPEVFGKEVIAVSTYVERTKQSMDSFLSGLGRYTDSKNFKISSNEKVDPILRFFDTNREYLEYKKQGKWIGELRVYERREKIPKEFTKKFFTEEFLSKFHEDEKFSANLYKIYTNQFNIDMENILGKYFDSKELEYFWSDGNVSNFLEKGPSFVGENLPTNIALPLLKNFISTSEEALENGDISANLRFAHAETIIPFASLLGIKFASVQTDDLYAVKDIWKDYQVAPMAANVQWIFYRDMKNPKRDFLVKMLYNEKEIEFPIESNMKPYYRWKDIKNYYEKRIEEIEIEN